MSKLNNAALGDLWIPVASLAALGAALGIGCRDLVRSWGHHDSARNLGKAAEAFVCPKVFVPQQREVA